MDQRQVVCSLVSASCNEYDGSVKGGNRPYCGIHIGCLRVIVKVHASDGPHVLQTMGQPLELLDGPLNDPRPYT